MLEEILFYVFLIISLFLLGYTIYTQIKFVKSKLEKKDYLKHYKFSLLLMIGFVISFTLMMLMVYFYSKLYKTALWYHYLLGIVGALLSSWCLIIFLSSFILHYYDNQKDKIKDKITFYLMMGGFALFLVFLFVMSDGYASLLTYPIINGIKFSSSGVAFTTPSTGTPTIAFYAIAILSGAIFVYFLCDHKMYVQYGKHGLLESTFLVAFPSGIIGARIFYVIGNWHEFAGRNWTEVFAIHDGGLTILGGAIVGIVVGVLWFMWRNKGYSIAIGVDMIVPTILLAQAIGRWGNFFNCEVHGVISDIKYWTWLPEIIWRNAQFSSTGPSLIGTNQLYVPLFLIEGIVNVLGYFILSYVFGKLFRKHTEFGDLAFGYVVWYGLTRTFMEPLRDGSFNMGEDGCWSWIWSIVFIAAGVLLIAINHIVRYYVATRKKKETKNYNNNHLIFTLVLGGISILLMVIGIVIMATNQGPLSISFKPFNIGLIVFIFSLAGLLLASINIPLIIDHFKKREVING